MRARDAARSLIVVGMVLALAGCSGGGGSDPQQGVYRGHIRDSNESPVQGARVSIDGIEAGALTDASGYYEVSDSGLSTESLVMHNAARVEGAGVDVEISVLAEGFTAMIVAMNVEAGAFADVSLARTGLEPALTISSPRSGETFVLDNACSEPFLSVDGFAGIRALESLRSDIVLVVDRSGSTSRPAFDVDGDGVPDSVLDVEIDALGCFVAGLDSLTTRAAVIDFNDAAGTVIEFTADLDAVAGALALVGPSTGGTNFEAAFAAAEDLFLQLEAADHAANPAEDPAEPFVAPFRAVVFVSDGIATSHGVPRDLMDSNLTQGAADRHGAIDAARSLGGATGAQLFAFSVIPAGDADRKLTTLPHCVAACGGGWYESVDSAEDLDDELCDEPLVPSLGVEIVNATLGGPPVSAAIRADGRFSAQVPAAWGPPGLVGPPGPDGTVENVIEVTLTVFPGPFAMTEFESVAVRVIDDASYAQMTANELFTAQAAQLPVSDTSVLSGPTGNPLSDTHLRDFLVGASTAEFEDAHELLGVDTFTANGPPAGAVTLTVDLVYEDGCHASDIGWFIVDPADAPSSAVNLLRGLTGANVLFNTGDAGSPSCPGQSIAAGSARATFTVPSGSRVAFFLIPDRTLADFQARPATGNHPLFTFSGLNPGKFDQALAFRTVNGRTRPGPSAAVEAAGPAMIFAIEDQPTVNKKSDQDFDDVVFTVSSEAVVHATEGGCMDP